MKQNLDCFKKYSTCIAKKIALIIFLFSCQRLLEHWLPAFVPLLIRLLDLILINRTAHCSIFLFLWNDRFFFLLTRKHNCFVVERCPPPSWGGPLAVQDPSPRTPRPGPGWRLPSPPQLCFLRALSPPPQGRLGREYPGESNIRSGGFT